MFATKGIQKDSKTKSKTALHSGLTFNSLVVDVGSILEAKIEKNKNEKRSWKAVQQKEASRTAKETAMIRSSASRNVGLKPWGRGRGRGKPFPEGLGKTTYR